MTEAEEVEEEVHINQFEHQIYLRWEERQNAASFEGHLKHFSELSIENHDQVLVSSDEQIFKVHRCQLESKSAVFRVMFASIPVDHNYIAQESGKMLHR